VSRPSLWATIILILLPAACQWPDLSGWLSSDPQVTVAGLSPHGWTGGGFLPGMPWIDGNAGATLQSLGGQAASQWLAGIVPWWNHYAGVGMPLAGEMQPAAFLLPFILLLRVAHGLVLLKIAMQVIAGLSMWALLRKLGIGRVAALAGGVLFELNGTFAWFGDTPMLPVAFLPLLLLGIERARDAAGGWTVIAIAVAGSLVAGFPETAYLDGLLATAWAALRLVRSPARFRFAVRLVLGAGVGVLIAAPVVLAFAEFLQVAMVGSHTSVSRPLDPESWAMMLFPYVLGPPLANYVGQISLGRYWWSMGGYLPILLVFLAATAMVTGRRSGLRWLLAVWIVLALACAGGVGPARWLFGLIPLVRQTSFFRYAVPSWELAACVMASLALDDVRHGQRGGNRVTMIAVACALAGGVALVPAWAELARFLARPGLGVFPAVAVGWGLTTILLATVLIRSRARFAHRWLAALAMVDAVILFAVPTFCGAPDKATDLAAVAMLHDRLGLHRAFGLGPVAPNYGSWFGVATVDEIYLPVPSLWANEVVTRLDPSASPYGFDGMSGRGVGDDTTARADTVSANRDALAALGVSLVLAPSARAMFGAPHPPAHMGVSWAARPIGPVLTGIVAPSGSPVEQFAIEAATYAGTADGQARLTLCAAARCVVAMADLATAHDNAMLAFAIAPALPGDKALTWTLDQASGTRPFAVWLIDGAPAVWLGTAGRPRPPRVYDDGMVAAYALDHPAEYFDTGGRCTVAARDWTGARLSCPEPATLIRRELSSPGWRATINGKPVPVGTADRLFQRVEVPAGVSDVRFHYAPPGVSWAWCAMAIGLAAVSWGVVRPQKLRFRRGADSRSRPAIP